MTGTIKKLMEGKYYGFILGADKREYFFHVDVVKNAQWTDLEEGQAVTFKDTKGPKGPRAEEVQVG